MKDLKQDEITEVYCTKLDLVHSSAEPCAGWHVEWWKAPDWKLLDEGFKICQRCHYVNVCRCMWCSRCNKITGNSNQGHYWAYCSVTRTTRDFHFCCPDNCELEETT